MPRHIVMIWRGFIMSTSFYSSIQYRIVIMAILADSVPYEG